MCGIAAILSYKPGESPAEESIKRMISTLEHRGPDGWGIYLSRSIAIGHTRLSILDLETGHQPMETKRYVISYNGEIFNHEELRAELKRKGTKFKTTSDTEVVLRAFDKYGIESFKMLNGQFAILIWDRWEKKLFAARDRYGIRPLYVLEYCNRYYFSSEIKAFDTIIGYNRTFDNKKLYDHALLWNTIGENTIFKDIRCLTAGSYEVFSKTRKPIKKLYYEIGESKKESHENMETAIEGFVELLTDAVQIRLQADVPVGAYLSGGIDSSVITHLISQNKRENLKTFSVGFKDSEHDESTFQKEMVSHINSDHISLDIGYKDINDNFLDAVYHFERPVFRTAGVPLFLLSKAVHDENIKVVLTGEGADELLFGYDSFKELKLLKFWNKFPESKSRPQLIKKLYPHLQHYSQPKQYGLMRMYYEGFLKGYNNELSGLNIRTHNNQILSKYFNKDHNLSFNKEQLIEDIKSILPENYYDWTNLQQNQFLEMKTLLSGYLLSSQGDRMSLGHSVEGRYPFLDHRLVDYLFYLKDSFKLNGFSQKFLLRKAFESKIPDSISKRPKKPYTSPDLKSFCGKKGLSEQASFFLSKEMIRDNGIFDEKIVSRLVNKFRNGAPKEIGYRDNMVITFILSSQMVQHWIKRPKIHDMNLNKMTVRIVDN